MEINNWEGDTPGETATDFQDSGRNLLIAGAIGLIIGVIWWRR